jgi:hypothetical protein
MSHTHESKLNGGRIPYAPKSIASLSRNKFNEGDTRPTYNDLKVSRLSKSGQKYALLPSGAIVRV